jgi:hypothetical protein
MTTTVPSVDVGMLQDELCRLWQEIAQLVGELGPSDERVFRLLVNEQLAAARRLLAALQALREEQ